MPDVREVLVTGCLRGGDVAEEGILVRDEGRLECRLRFGEVMHSWSRG